LFFVTILAKSLSPTTTLSTVSLLPFVLTVALFKIMFSIALFPLLSFPIGPVIYSFSLDIFLCFSF